MEDNENATFSDEESSKGFNFNSLKKEFNPFATGLTRAKRIVILSVFSFWLFYLYFNLFDIDNNDNHTIVIFGHSCANFFLVDSFTKLAMVLVIPFLLLRGMQIAWIVGTGLLVLNLILPIMHLSYPVFEASYSIDFEDLLEVFIFGGYLYILSRNDILSLFKIKRKKFFLIIGASILVFIGLIMLLMLAFAFDSGIPFIKHK